jgi:hypothetical protein
MPDLIPAHDGIFDRHPVSVWIPAFAGMTALRRLIAGAVFVYPPETTKRLHGLTAPESSGAVSASNTAMPPAIRL